MTTSARAIIRITALPDSGLSRALKGTVSASQRAQDDIAKGQKKSDKEKERSADALSKYQIATQRRSAQMAQAQRDREERAAKKSADTQARDAKKLADTEAAEAKRAADLKAREDQKLADWRVRLQRNSAAMMAREEEKSIRAQAQLAQKALRSQQAVMRERKDMFMRLGALGVGAATAVYGRVQSFAGAYGARSNEDLATKAIDFRRRSILVSDMGGQTAAERDAMQQKVLSASVRTGVDAGDLLKGLEVAQDRFSGLKDFTAIIDDLADISTATGASVTSVVGAMGVMRRQFDLSDEEMTQLGGSMVRAADLGNISFDDMANNFAGALGAMGRDANLKGLPGAQQALGLTQLLGTSDMSPSEAATLGIKTVSSLNDVKVQKKLAMSRKQGGFGINVTQDGKLGTALRPMAEILQEMALKGVMDPSYGARRQEIFKEERGQRGISVLVDAFNKNPMAAEELLNVDPALGQAAIKRRVGAMNEGTLGKAATMGARNFQEFMTSGGMDHFLDVTVKSADALQKLQAQYPMLTETIGVTADALKAFGAMLVLQTLFGRRGVGGGMLPLPAGLGGGTLASAPVAVGGTAPVAGSLGLASAASIAIAGGVFTFTITRAIMEMTGGDDFFQKLGSKLFEVLNGDHEAGMIGKAPGRGLGGADPNYKPAFDFAAHPTNKSAMREAMDQLGPKPRAWSWDMTDEAGSFRNNLDLSKPAPAATLKIDITGPGRVVSVDSNDGFGVIDVNHGSMRAPQ